MTPTPKLPLETTVSKILRLNHSTAQRLQSVPVGTKFSLSIKAGKRRKLKSARLLSRSVGWCDTCEALHVYAEVSTSSGPISLES